ncbi:hypothetical protein ACOSQ2_032334 [Xanthoceras sorbifolium]
MVNFCSTAFNNSSQVVHFLIWEEPKQLAFKEKNNKKPKGENINNKAYEFQRKQECRSSPPSGRLSFSVKTALSKLPLPLLALLLSLLIRGDLAELGCFRAAGAFFDQLSVVCGAQRAVVLEALDRVVWSCCGARSWRCSDRFCLQLGGAVIWWGCDLVELRGLLWRGPNQGLGSRSGQFGVWGS